MKTLGVSGVKNRVYLAIADGDTILAVEPSTFELPAGLEPGKQLLALRDEVAKSLGVHRIDKVRILDAEQTYEAAYRDLCVRLSIETVVQIAAAEAGIDCYRMSRPRLRSLLEIPAKGKLPELVGAIHEPVGKYWKGKRDIAAAVAIAGNREQ